MEKDGMTIARTRIAEEAEARTGTLDIANLGLTDFPDDLFALEHLDVLHLGGGASPDNRFGDNWKKLTRLKSDLRELDCQWTGLSDLTPLKNLVNLQSLNCIDTRITDLTPLKNLTNLQSLNCYGTQITDLTPLKNLTNLQSLNCASTQIADLAPLKNLTNLQSLNCDSTQITDLAPLKNLVNLQSLNCSGTEITDLTPLKNLTNLQSLNCYNTQITNLTPLKNLANLQSLNCNGTQITDLTPLKNLTNLQSLDCYNTQISDLTPIKNLSNLQIFDCDGTKVTDIRPLSLLRKLETLDIRHLNIQHWSDAIWTSPKLETVYAHAAKLRGIPTDILPSDFDANALPAIRAHLADLGEDPIPFGDVKLMILGNGRVGKTQIGRRLRGLEPENEPDSTHGIIIDDAPIPGERDRKFRLWDFGGQDIYHGTHALFLKSRAVFVLVWTPESNNSRDHEYGGKIFRNYPLDYWLDYIHRFGGKDARVILLENQCDTPGSGCRETLYDPEKVKNFSYFKSLDYSAHEDLGRAALDEALAEATSLIDRPLMGSKRRAIMDEIEGLQNADQQRDKSERINRTLLRRDFDRMCDRHGGVADTELFLKFLHNTGTVFYDATLFGDHIILDQSWALEAIYTVFERGKCFDYLTQDKGQFRPSRLNELIWKDAYSEAEQALFIHMMQSCEIIFKVRDASKDGKFEAEFIAPEFLPIAPSDTLLQERWDVGGEIGSQTLTYPLLPSGVMRAIMSRFGRKAGHVAEYWRNGFYIYDAQTRSRGLIAQDINPKKWDGTITIETRKGDAETLLARLTREVLSVSRHMNLAPTEAEDLAKSVNPSERKGTDVKGDGDSPETAMPNMTFTSDDIHEGGVYVSYAWNDDRTENGAKLEADVDRACERASRQGITLIRDKNFIRYGDRISKFMQDMSAGKHVLIFLSRKYVQSPYCMFELTEIYRRTQFNDAAFMNNITLWAVDDIPYWDEDFCLDTAIYWKEKYVSREEKIMRHGTDILGTKGLARHNLTRQIYSTVGDILEALGDHIQVRTFEDFMETSIAEITDKTTS